MRPWEYMAMDAEELYLVNALKTAFQEGRQEAKEERADSG